MADVRGTPQFEGVLSPELATFTFDASITYTSSFYDGTYHSPQLPAGQPGAAVTLVGSGQVGLGASGGYLAGRLESVEKTACSVTARGCVGFRYNSAGANPPIVGRGVVVDGTGLVISPAGGVRTAGERGNVLSLDSTNQIAYVQL